MGKWNVEIRQFKKYDADGEIRKYTESVKLVFDTVGSALSFCEIALKHAEEIKIVIWYEQENIKEEK